MGVARLTQAQCPANKPLPGNVTLTSQAQVDALAGAFPNGCTTLSGTLTINGPDITNLDGLNGLGYISGALVISNNPQLTNITGLTALTGTQYGVKISGNDLLTKLDGLNKLRSVGGNLELTNNPQLTSLAALTALTTVSLDLIVSNNAVLTTLNGLNNLRSIASLQLTKNPQLTSIIDLTSLTRADGGLLIQGNAALATLDGLNNIQKIVSLQLTNNPQLTSITGLTSLTSVLAYVWINSNASLTTLDGLNSLQSVGGDLQLIGNPKLTSIATLTALTSLGKDLQIGYNTLLTSLNGLNKLQSVKGNLLLVANPQLTSIDALAALTSVGSLLRLNSNSQLTSLVGLTNLQQVGGALEITSNPVLSICAFPAICQLIATKSPDQLTVSGNAPGCNSVPDIQAECSPLVITTQPPAGSAVCQGSAVTAAVSITGNARAYQWYKGDQLVAGQTTPTLGLSNVQPADAGAYWVMITSQTSSVTSTAFTLTVTAASPDYQPLVDLYNATGGANWTRRTNWLTGCTPCGWQGVTCTNGRVTSLNLIGNNLVGTLPASLSALTSLQSLELGANALTGGIPTGIGSLTALQTLNLSRTQLGGGIPPSLGQLTRLQNLLLNESQLTGSLPTNLATLTQLQNLQLYTNQLSGCFPASYTALCGRASISFTGNPDLPGGGDFGSFCSTGTGSELVVSQGPRSGTACVGSTFSFSVVARGAGSYEWYKEGQRLTESGPVLSFSTVSAADAGTYQVYINYGCRPGAVQSDYVTLTVPQPGTGGCPPVNTAPVATANASQTAVAGQPFSYAVNSFTDVQTPTSLTYSASISPAIGLAFDPATRVLSGTPTATGAITVTITATDPGGLSAITSFNVTVVMPPTPVITTQPATGSSVCVGAGVRISVAASSSGSLTYQWYKDGSLLSGQTSATLTLDNVTVPQGGSYRAMVSNGFSSATSTAFSLTVNPIPVVSISPSSTAICAGKVATLTASGGTNYRWNTGQISQSISVSATGTYAVTATSASGCLASSTASVTVNSLPVVSISPTAATVCAGSTLTATPGLASYRWSTGQTTQSISVTVTATYAVTATNASGCSAAATTPVTVTPQPAAPYATSVSRRLYTTNFPIPLILYALPTSFGLDLNFYNGATNAQISPAFVQPNKPGVFAYYATQTDSKGCVSLPTPVSLTVLEGGTLATKPADRTVGQGANTVLNVTATGSNPRYSWYEATPGRPYNVVEVGSNTKGGNTASLTVSKLQRTTLYYCLVVGQNGLDVAGPIKVTLNTNCQGRLGVDEPVTPLSVVVLGNPVQGAELSVEIRGAEGQPLQLYVTDSQGRAVGEQHLQRAEAVERLTVALGSQPAGMLLLQVSTPTQRQTVKILKTD